MAELTKKQRYWKQHVDADASFDGSLVDYARKLPHRDPNDLFAER